MKTIISFSVSCIFILFAFTISSVFSEDLKMTHIEYRVIHPSIKAGTFSAASKKMWRIGFSHLRLEEKPDHIEKIHALMICNSPDVYIINLYTNSGKHIIDTSDDKSVHIPVFQDPELPKEVGKLEMGYELDFFSTNDAKQLSDKSIDDILCKTYQTSIKGFILTLYQQKNNKKPFQLAIRKGKFGYDIRYDNYEKNLEPDYLLFEPPKGIKLTRAN